MKKFLPLLGCLSLSLFTVARATKPAHALVPGTKTAQEESTGQEAGAKPLLKNTNTSEEGGSDDDDSADNASAEQGEDINEDDGSGAVGDEDTGADDGSGGEGE